MIQKDTIPAYCNP